MLSFLKNHPFAVAAYFESSLVLTFALPKEQLQRLIPECLEIETFEDKWAFVAVALVQTKNLRPKGFPEFMGSNFFLVGYRIFVRYRNNAGKRLRGLYILRSETDKKTMEFLGNLFTGYKYSTTDISQVHENGRTEIVSVNSDFKISFGDGGQQTPLPTDSPFKDWTEARRFCGPLPFTFSYNKRNKEVLIVEGQRQHWMPEPVDVIDYKFGFLNSPELAGAVLANAFVVKNTSYWWEKGRKEIWSS